MQSYSFIMKAQDIMVLFLIRYAIYDPISIWFFKKIFEFNYFLSASVVQISIYLNFHVPVNQRLYINANANSVAE